MTQRTAKINGRIEKISQQGKKYVQYPTSIGDLNLFDQPKIDALDSCVGTFATMDIVMRGKYMNVNDTPRLATPEEVEAAGGSAGFNGNQGVNQMPTAEPMTQTMNTLNTKEVQKIVHEIIDDTARNWVEVGKAQERVKIYFKNQVDLQEKLKVTLMTIRKVQFELDSDSTTEAS